MSILKNAFKKILTSTRGTYNDKRGKTSYSNEDDVIYLEVRKK